MMDVSPSEVSAVGSLLGWDLCQALKDDDPAEVLRCLSALNVSTVTHDPAGQDCANRQVAPVLHEALNSAMRQGRFACAKLLIDLVADAAELNTVSELICPVAWEPDEYHPPTPSHQHRSSHLHVAVSLGSPVLVQMLLTKGASLLVQDSNQNTPLISLTRSTCPEHCLPTVRALLGDLLPAGDAKRHADILSFRGLAALHYAVARGLDDVVSFLLDECQASVDPYIMDDPGDPSGRRCVGFSPLHVAIMVNNHWAVGRLLAAGADVNLFLATLYYAHAVPHIRIIGRCDCGCDFHHRFHIAPPIAIDVETICVCPALGLAAYLDDSDTVQALVEAGAEVDAKDSFGCTPLGLSIFWSNYRCVRILLPLAATADTLPESEGGLLHLALSEPVSSFSSVRHQKLVTINSVVEEVINTGKTDINSRNRSGSTALILACRHGFVTTVPMLVVRGWSLTAQDRCGRTALFYATFYAAQWNNRLMVKVLVQFGAACLEPRPDSKDGVVQVSRSPALAALYYVDVLTLFLLYKGGALRRRKLIKLLVLFCLVSRDSELWSDVFHTSRLPAPVPEKRGVNVSTLSQLFGELSHEDSESIIFFRDMSPDDMEELVDSDLNDWQQLLMFCDLPEDSCSLEEHERAFPQDSDSEDSHSSSYSSDSLLDSNDAKQLHLMLSFLQKVDTTVPSLCDLCRWAVREAIGDGPLARKRARTTLKLPSAVMSQLMIGCRLAPGSARS